MCQDDSKALLCLAGKTEQRVLLMTRRVDCKDHSRSEGGQKRGRRAGRVGREEEEDQEQGANARIKGIFGKVADQQRKLGC